MGMSLSGSVVYGIKIPSELIDKINDLLEADEENNEDNSDYIEGVTGFFENLDDFGLTCEYWMCYDCNGLEEDGDAVICLGDYDDKISCEGMVVLDKGKMDRIKSDFDEKFGVCIDKFIEKFDKYQLSSLKDVEPQFYMICNYW